MVISCVNFVVGGLFFFIMFLKVFVLGLGCLILEFVDILWRRVVFNIILVELRRRIGVCVVRILVV